MPEKSESGLASEIQRIQTRYRRRLAKDWQIPKGAAVLEIGCGQGDMTTVLAEAIGSTGHLTAVDIADPSYGCPITLGEAAEQLKASRLGHRVEFHFNFDILAQEAKLERRDFDAVVLCHSSWYFASPDQLLKTLSRVRPWTKKLFLTEWDLEPRSFDQLAHLLAVFIQGQVEAFKTQSLANVRTPLTKTELRRLLLDSGWEIAKETRIKTGRLQDADWEIRGCFDDARSESRKLCLPPGFMSQIETQLSLLELLAKDEGNRPLDAYSIVAKPK